jgi:hypothetical protein
MRSAPGEALAETRRERSNFISHHQREVVYAHLQKL